MKRKQIAFEIPWPTFSINKQTLLPAIRKWLPSRGNVLFTFVMIAVLLWAQSAGAVSFLAPRNSQLAASTGTIAYQGRLADSAGTPLTQTLAMSFRLYSAVTGGTPLWTEQWSGPNGVKVSDGLFNVMLGSLTPIAQSVITGNSNLFLGITVGTDDEMTPRVQLGSVPFAVHALSVPDGSITAAKLAADVSLVPPAGSITTTMIAANAVAQMQSATGSTDDNTSSTSFVDVPGRVITLTTTGGPILVMFSGSHVTFMNGVVGYWRIIRDDSVVVAYNNHAFANAFWQSISIFGTDSPAAGLHTYKVQWRVSSGTLVGSAQTYTQNFVAVEFKR